MANNDCLHLLTWVYQVYPAKITRNKPALITKYAKTGDTK